MIISRGCQGKCPQAADGGGERRREASRECRCSSVAGELHLSLTEPRTRARGRARLVLQPSKVLRDYTVRTLFLCLLHGSCGHTHRSCDLRLLSLLLLRRRVSATWRCPTCSSRSRHASGAGTIRSRARCRLCGAAGCGALTKPELCSDDPREKIEERKKAKQEERSQNLQEPRRPDSLRPHRKLLGEAATPPNKLDRAKGLGR